MNRFMQAAIKEAQAALADLQEVPVGAVIVQNGQIIAAAHNRKEQLHDPTAHAEILALRKAGALLSDWRLTDCDLYVTLTPCPMCMAAIRQARIRRLYCGAPAPSEIGFEMEPETYYGIEEEACTNLLQAFFREKRQL